MSPTPTHILSHKPHQDVLAMVGRYHYVTAMQVSRLLYSPTYKTYASKLLMELTEAGYLANVNWIPKGRSAGRPPYVWSLRPRGYRALEDMGIEVAMRMRYKLERSQYFMAHTETINDTLIAAELLARDSDNVELTGFLHEEALKRERLNPTPDGWTRYQIGDESGAILWEIDRGTEDRTKWQQKMIAYWDFLEGDESAYNALGGDESVQVAIVVRTNPTQRTRAPQERCAELIDWTERALSSDWGPYFSFTAVDPAEVSPTSFFTDTTWLHPFETTTHALIPRERLS